MSFQGNHNHLARYEEIKSNTTKLLGKEHQTKSYHVVRSGNEWGLSYSSTACTVPFIYGSVYWHLWKCK